MALQAKGTALYAKEGRKQPLSNAKTSGLCLQERTEGHNLQGRDSTAQYFYRNSMADPEYTVNDSRRQRLVPRGLVTPTVHVAEGTRPCPVLLTLEILCPLIPVMTTVTGSLALCWWVFAWRKEFCAAW